MAMADSDGHRMNLARAAKWHLPVWMYCGECDYLGCSAFTLTATVPWVAQGINRHAAFGSKRLPWTLLFLVLLIPIGFVVFGSVAVKPIRCYTITKEKYAEYEGKPMSLCLTEHRFRPWVFAVCTTMMTLFLFIWTIYGIATRIRIRQEYNIRGHWIKDVLLWFLCQPCVLAQETRTLMKYNLEGSDRRPLSIDLPTHGGGLTNKAIDSAQELPL